MDRPIYLNQLIRKQNNGMIKVITGIRRVGKSYLLFNLFYSYLLNQGIKENHIIRIALDDRKNKKFRNPDTLLTTIEERITDEELYYILLDEVQLVPEFEDVLNSFLYLKNVDVYVTGSNAKFLSKDIITEFRGRGDQVHVFPLTFSEFMTVYAGDKRDGWDEYLLYGGLPMILSINQPADKAQYLKNLFEETYLKDIQERNSIRNMSELDELLNVVASSVGSLVNPNKLSNTFKTAKNISFHPDTIKKYLDYLEDAFLIHKAQRYDVKGKKYIGTPYKYYYIDLGLRNARLNFRQFEETHLMENVIFNELLVRGYNVDVGVVEYSYYDNNKRRKQKSLEIDFVCNMGSKRVYIQSALSLSTEQKMEQEQNSLLRVSDAFIKVIITKDGPTYYNENGVLIINIFDFLLEKERF